MSVEVTDGSVELACELHVPQQAILGVDAVGEVGDLLAHRRR